MKSQNDPIAPQFKAETFPNTSLKELNPVGGLTKLEFFSGLALIGLLQRETYSMEVHYDAVKIAKDLMTAINEQVQSDEETQDVSR
jgi:hypothetical protein